MQQNIEASKKHPSRITRLVFSGGGAAGVVYPGAFSALVDTGVFDDVEHLAGSSAGAMTAALLAVGLSPSALKEQSLNTNFGNLLGNRTSGSLFEHDGKPVYEFIKHNINLAVNDILVKKDPLDSRCKYILEKLLNDIENASITFGDLTLLHQVYPKHFKELTVTAVRVKDGELQLFNSETPDVEIALACKASGALPTVFSSVEINEERYIDGGVYDNIPTDSFDKDSNEIEGYTNKKRNKTLIFGFVEGIPGKKKSLFSIILGFFNWDNFFNWRSIFTFPAMFAALFGGRAHETSIQHPNSPAPARKTNLFFQPTLIHKITHDYLAPLISGFKTDYKLTHKRDASIKRIHDHYPLRTVGINTDNLLAVDFDRATATSRLLMAIGYLDTIDMIFNHDLHLLGDHKPEYDTAYAEEFYKKIIYNFINLYEATLTIMHKDPMKDKLMKKLKDFKTPPNTTLTLYHMIREATENNHHSIAAFALGYAVEFRNKTPEEILVFTAEATRDDSKPQNRGV